MKISVITVTYNSELFVEDCLASVACQSNANFEHLVIDGASSDSTMSILQKKSDQLSVLVSEPDEGIYDAMNKGIYLANGEIIGFLNSDDIYANNNVLSVVTKVFNEDPSLDACYSDLIYVDQLDTSQTVRYWQSNDFHSGAFAMGWSPPHPTFFVRRSVYDRFGVFNLDYRIAADFELMMRFIEIHNIKVRYISGVWVKMRLGGTTNKSLKNIWAQNREILHILDLYGHKVSLPLFFSRKFISRSHQFFDKPSL